MWSKGSFFVLVSGVKAGEGENPSSCEILRAQGWVGRTDGSLAHL